MNDKNKIQTHSSISFWTKIIYTAPRISYRVKIIYTDPRCLAFLKKILNFVTFSHSSLKLEFRKKVQINKPIKKKKYKNGILIQKKKKNDVS